jgi:hypothetical protein
VNGVSLVELADRVTMKRDLEIAVRDSKLADAVKGVRLSIGSREPLDVKGL